MLNFLLILLVLFALIWSLFLTILFWKMLAHYNKLSENSNGKGLKVILDQLLKESSENKKDIEMLREYCDRINDEGQLHIQKVGLLRFNPFKDTGGDQSFILSLVDKNNTGVIISGLYSRSGLRWYAKKVENGKATEHELSDDERKALKEAGESKKK